MIFGAFDPGLQGAGAFIDDPELDIRRTKELNIEFFDMPMRDEPVKNRTRNRIDCTKLGAFILPYVLSVLEDECELWLEHLWGFGSVVKNGEIGQFVFAENYGIIKCAIELQVGREGYNLIAPIRWQNLLQKPKDVRKDYDKSKKWNIEKICDLYPQAQLIPDGCRVPSSGRADALCIAHAARILHLAKLSILTRKKRA